MARGSFNSNHVRSTLFKDTSVRLRPEAKYINRYREYLTDVYNESLQKQLKISQRVYNSYRSGGDGGRSTHKHLGYATGALRDSVRGLVKVKTKRDTTRGRYYINYELLEPNFLEYGHYISGGRNAGYIPVATLIDWIETKIANSAFRLITTKKSKFGGRGSRHAAIREKAEKRDKQILGVAIAISRAAAKSPKPPVIRDWHRIDKNKRLNLMFNQEVRRHGGYYRTQIRNSIIKKLNIRYGNKQ